MPITRSEKARLRVKKGAAVRLDLSSARNPYRVLVRPLTSLGLRALLHPTVPGPVVDPREEKDCRIVKSPRGLTLLTPDAKGQVAGFSYQAVLAYVDQLDPESEERADRVQLLLQRSHPCCGEPWKSGGHEQQHRPSAMAVAPHSADILIPDWLRNLRLVIVASLFDSIELEQDAQLELEGDHSQTIFASNVTCAQGSRILLRIPVRMQVSGTFRGPG